MMTLMKRYILPALMAVICWSGVNAQDEVLPSRSLTIEGSYNPAMSEQGKIMPVPERQQTQRQATTVTYRTESNPHKGYERTPMGVFAEQSDDVETRDLDGLLRLGFGLRSLIDGVADLNWKITDKDVFRVSGLMDGWGTRPDGDWKSRMFNSDMVTGYSHSFDSIALGVDFGFGHSRFNYREGSAMTQAIMDKSNLNNRTNRSNLNLWVKGDMRKLKWSFSTGMEWYNRKGLMINSVSAISKERIIRLYAGLEAPVCGSTGGLEYRQKSVFYDWLASDGTAYRQCTSLTLSPYWYKSWGDLDTRLGFNIDFHSMAQRKLLFCPMVTASYRAAERIRLQAGFTGGLRENDMRTLERISPYWSDNGQIKDSYDLSDLWAGVAFSQSTWYNVSAKVGYRHTLDELFQVARDGVIVTSQLCQQNADVLYVRMDADMQIADRGQVRFDVTYSDYMGKYAGGKLMLKPMVDASLFGKVNILPGLDALLTYRAQAFYKVDGKSLPMVNDLALSVDYDLMDNLSLYLTGNRLVGGDWYYYAGYRSIKPSVMIGATYRF